jgi:hypothetical protein
MTIISREPVKLDTSAEDSWSRRQPVSHVVILGCLTFSIYILYWIYKTLRLLKTDAQQQFLLEKHAALSMFQKINPLLRTLALLSPLAIALIPFMAGILKAAISDLILIYVFATLTVGVALLEPDETSFQRKHPLVSCGLVLGLSLLLASTVHLNGFLFFLSIPAAVVPCAFVQYWLNHYLVSIEPENWQVRTMLNAYEIVAIIFGAGLLGLIAAGTMMGIH